MNIGDLVVIHCSDLMLNGRRGEVRSRAFTKEELHPALKDLAPFRNVWIKDESREPHLDQMFCIEESKIKVVSSEDNSLQK